MPVSLLGHNATDYHFEAKDVENDLSIEYSEQSSDEHLNVDTGDVGSLRGSSISSPRATK